MPGAWGFDPVGALSVTGRHTSAIELGASVVPTWPRHPFALAQQALTAAAATSGRFTLGLGVSHRDMMTEKLGLAMDRPLRHMDEYLEVISPLLSGERADFTGELYDVHAELSVTAGGPVPIILAALGPAMLRLAGRRASGIITSWVGPRTLAEHTIPTLTEAAAAAGRPAPRVIVALPILLTDEADAARDQLAEQAAFYNDRPAYQAMFERSGVSGPAELAIFGDEALLDRALSRLESLGASDFVAQLMPIGHPAMSRTLGYLSTWQQEHGRPSQ